MQIKTIGWFYKAGIICWLLPIAPHPLTLAATVCLLLTTVDRKPDNSLTLNFGD